MTDVGVGEVTAYPSTRPYIDEALFSAPLSSELRTLMAGGTSVDLHRRLAASLPATSLRGGNSAGRRQLTVSSSALAYSLPSRASSASIVTPTSGTPPNTVPSLPPVKCCWASLYACSGSGT